MSFDLTSLRQAICDHGNVVRVVVAEIKGSAPREVGAAMMVWADGQSGTIGGGELEWQATEKARDLLSGGTQLDRYPLGPALGQCCGGAVTVLSEHFDQTSLEDLSGIDVFARAPQGGEPPLAVHRAIQRYRDRGESFAPELVQGWMIEPMSPSRQPVWIYGAGHVGRALVNMLAPLPQFAITWVDTGPERFPADIPDGVTVLPAANPGNAVKFAPDDAHHLVLTYSHQIDLALCHAILLHGHFGLGLIGSATKWSRFQSRLADLGHDHEKIRTINCPIGDPGLGKHPQAIAIGVTTALLKGAAEKMNHDRGIASYGGDSRAGRAADA
ncbi:xanthine dehydrogenase accessory protein XdhC [Aliiroseovarius sp. KMU-50]|uniref:Xanthine dehydrogenase accessory protein XdhC n=1 Tax=Aliiroseovarius salicola TaxID=3009082 RepID=A0ABT4VYV1_9RHOB|nr:xanthine dehydrogenase accessory protein XdhC [Aliiroseovarius sp. KMU-50]MDA5093436.1 xanthine dehydrogenase accessory protein XdhC [Aliiroseovarius sp. KMU-50]